mmetsp:Transcript_16042/g.25664  ORF Transcript_16042/g.25664 Transcript_16042/m.25664 type:complete len:144 (-) Transcript_16042:929-1360(-)
MCTIQQKRVALLSGYVALTLLSISVVVSTLTTANDGKLRFSYQFCLMWHSLMTIFTLLLVGYWRGCHPESNMLLSGSVVTLFMMALQSASTCASSWTWEGNLEEENNHLHYFSFGLLLMHTELPPTSNCLTLLSHIHANIHHH